MAVGVLDAVPPTAAVIAIYLGSWRSDGFAGPARIGWIKDFTGSFPGGRYFVAAPLILSAVLTLVLSRAIVRQPAAASA